MHGNCHGSNQRETPRQSTVIVAKAAIRGGPSQSPRQPALIRGQQFAGKNLRKSATIATVNRNPRRPVRISAVAHDKLYGQPSVATNGNPWQSAAFFTAIGCIIHGNPHLRRPTAAAGVAADVAVDCATSVEVGVVDCRGAPWIAVDVAGDIAMVSAVDIVVEIGVVGAMTRPSKPVEVREPVRGVARGLPWKQPWNAVSCRGPCHGVPPKR